MSRLPGLIAWVLLAGCAAEAPAPDPAPTFVATDQPAATTLEEAQKLGYKVVNEDGRTMYCRETPKLGSHVQKDRTCLTEDELLAARDANQRNFENMKKVIGQRKGN